MDGARPRVYFQTRVPIRHGAFLSRVRLCLDTA